MNEFSILCRVLGSLFYRQPQDPLLVPLFTLISEGKLSANWPLEQDELLTRLQKSCDMPQLAADYNALFVGDECAVPPYRSASGRRGERIRCSCISFCSRNAAGRYACRSYWHAVAGGFMA